MQDHRHALYQLADLIDWNSFEKDFGLLYCDFNGSPGKLIRLMVGLEYLKQIHNMSDEQVVKRWVENPYWQYSCGEVYFRHEMRVETFSGPTT